MTQFSNICGTSPVNNQILSFDGHKIHFDDCALTQMQRKNTKPFILKSGDSINGDTNENRLNSKLKALYNVLKAKWVLKHSTTRFQHYHMNSVFFELWESFTVSAGNIIRYIFAKTHLPPSSLPSR